MSRRKAVILSALFVWLGCAWFSSGTAIAVARKMAADSADFREIAVAWHRFHEIQSMSI